METPIYKQLFKHHNQNNSRVSRDVEHRVAETTILLSSQNDALPSPALMVPLLISLLLGSFLAAAGEIYLKRATRCGIKSKTSSTDHLFFR